MAKPNKFLEGQDKVDLTPMIDVVFLLLIYFMVTTQLLKQEADLGITLPAEVALDQPPPNLPDEHFIEVNPDGQILLNGQPFDDPFSITLPELKGNLVRLKQSSELAGVETLITVMPSDDARHERVIAVLNACKVADIKMVSFGVPE